MEQNWFPTGTPESQGKVECIGGRPSQLGLKIAVDLFFVGRTDKVETMAGPRKI